MSWAIYAVGTREAVLKQVQAFKPSQHQAALAKELIIDELERETDVTYYSPETGKHEPVNGVKVDAGGHSSPQSYDTSGNYAEDATHKSGNLRIIIEPMNLLLDNPKPEDGE